MKRWWLGVLVASTLLAGCRRDRSDEQAAVTDDPVTPASGDFGPPEPPPPPRRGMVWVPGGALVAGTPPQSLPRIADEEMPGEQVILGGFYVDVYPYPNEDGAIPLTNVSQPDASRLCEEQHKRLCTELEWERACKGPQSDAYAGGPRWPERCAKEPTRCASGFDVLAMGAAIREWTISEVAPADSSGLTLTGSRESSGSKKRAVAVRGAAASSAGPAHHCARREPVDPDTRSSDLGFRCCGGAPNGAVIREPTLGQAFVKSRLTAERLERLLRADRRTVRLAKDVKLFREPDAAETVVARGPGDRQGFDFTVSPLVWNPAAGARYLLVSGRSGDKTCYVLAFHIVGEDDYRLLASFVMLDEPGPVAFAYSASIRPRLHFSTCWGCPGETGKILYRPPDSVAVLQP